MNWADYAILTVVLVSVLFGVFRGLTRELLGIAGWVLAFWVAFSFSESAADWLQPHIDTPSVRKAVAFGGLFLLSLLLAAIATFFAASAIRDSRLSGVDRTLGGGFGFLRGLLVVAALLLVASGTAARKDPWWQQSLFVPHLEWLADAVKAVLPEHWIRLIESPDTSPGPDAPRQGRPR